MQRQIPTYSSAWIGAPPDAKTGVPGQDVFGMTEMAKANTTNPLFFWCLGPHVPHYEKEFKDYPNVKVMSIEKFLDSFPKDSPMGQRAKIVKKVKKILLDDPERNKNLDKVVFKEIFFVFLLYAFGGWMADSNMRPIPGKKVSLPRFDKVYIPLVSGDHEFKYSEIKLTDLEIWALYSPQSLSKVAKELFDGYYQCFLKREEIFKKEGYSKRYHNTVSDSTLIPAADLVRKGKIGLWPGEMSETHSYVYLHQFNLMKNYYNTHRFEYSGLFDKNIQSLKKISTDKLLDQLFYAIQDNDDDKLEDLLVRGMNLNRQVKTEDAIGETALHYAIKNNKVNAVRILLKYHPNLSLCAQYDEFDDKKMTPYDLALALNT